MVGLRLGVSSYWMNSYWGGAVAATGGALVLGALPRMRRAPHWGQAVVMGIGLAILANSRSFEGAVFGLVVGAALTVWMLGRNGPPRAAAARQIIIPLALQLTLLAAGLGFYFARVTGSPWTPPYLLYRSSLTSAPHFLWQSPRPEPLYNNREMRHFYTGLEMSAFRRARGAPLAHLMEKTGYYWRFYFGPIFTIPLISLPFLWRDRASRQLLLMMAGIWLALAGQVWHNAHYAAPATGLFILIVILGMRRLRVWRWRGRPTGACLVRILPVAACAMLILQISAGRVPAQADVVAGWRWPAAGGLARARVLEALDRSGGKHLIFVRYGPWHDPGDEWVYNGADIDGSRVVWARELDRFSNARLMAYFGSRRVWLIEPDLPSPQAVPYQDAQPRPMPFVQLGAPGIESLRSVEELGRKIHAQAGDRLLSCDQWNYYFTEVSGVMGPEVSNGCYSGNDRGQSINFENYFSWLQRQR